MPKKTLLLAMVLAFAQSPASAQQSPTPQEFAREAAISNTFELQAAELAVKRAKDARAVSFAKDMLIDHGRSSGDLAEAAETDGIPVSAGLDERRQKQLDALLSAPEADFDQAYLSTQVTAHEDAVALFDAYGKNGAAGALKTFAQKTIGTLRMHDLRVHDLTDQK